MSGASFPAALAFVLSQEGSWADLSGDPGGATNFGITLRTLQSYQQGATVEDLKTISDSLVSMIYHREYWTVMGCDNLPSGPDLSTFDAGVNCGPARSIGFLQTVAGVRRDGIDGAITQAAVAKMSASDVITKLAGLRKAFYEADPNFPRFGEDWLRRNEQCAVAALRLIPATKGTPTA